MLQLQATVKRFLFDLRLDLEGQHALVYGFKDKSRRTDMVNQTAESTGKSSNFHVFGHNVLTYYFKLVSVRKRNEGLEGCFQLKHYT